MTNSSTGEVLSRFLRRVWRRPATSPEVDQFLALFAKYRPDFATFEAMIEVLATAAWRRRNFSM
ncbi:MAG: DUF1595 domain-containing protein [Pirellulaceae bacterium]